ncbi:hypothetical protein J0H58_12635 [bacterium]|nr:hypothetical protein [bacterium]
MLSGHQIYNLEIGGYSLIQLPAFDLSFPSYPGVDKVEVVSSGERSVTVKVAFKEVASTEDAASIALVIATQVADRLAFAYKVPVGDPVRREAIFLRQDGSGTVPAILATYCTLVAVGHTVKSITTQDVAQLAPAIVCEEPAKDAYYSQIRLIIRQDDPVARFMHLYKILLSLQGGSNHTQKQVDAFITSVEPTVQTVFNAHQGRGETIYTRLRNEVGHEIAGTTPATTRQGMERHVDRLLDHVKEAISRIP